MNTTIGGIVFRQRDVVLIPFPYTDLTGTKQRPALIISNSKLNNTQDRICCLITSKPSKEGILINNFEIGKLPFKSWIKPHRIFTIDENIIKRKLLCRIDPSLHKSVLADLKELLK